MPKSDTWPGGVSVESVSGMDSAGSCDSVLSNNSGFSDDSLEHLSAEEIACLMFLEETIESLEAEEDSGLSNDEPDHPSNGPKATTPQRTFINHNRSEELSVHEDPNKVIGRDRKSQKYLVPTPLLLAGGIASKPMETSPGNAKIVSRPMDTSPGNAKIVSRPMDTSPGNAKVVIKPKETTPRETQVAFIDAPDGFRSSPDLQQPIKTVSEEALSKVATSKTSSAQSADVVDLPPSFIPEPPVKTSLLSDLKAKDGAPKSSDVKPQKVPSEVPLEFIPPPSDFMDEPAQKTNLTPGLVYEEPPEWIPELPKVEPGVSSKPTEMTKSDPESHNVIEILRNKASLKKAPHLTPLTVVQHSVADKSMTPSPTSEHSPSTLKEYGDPKSPPVVAPKPKKLPPNIILKSHKEPGVTHSLTHQTERAPMDPQKVRMEALKKLGLLKNDEIETGHGASPSHSPTFKAKTRPQSFRNATDPAQELSRLSESPVPDEVQLLADTVKHQHEKRREDSVKKQPTKSYEIKTASLERSRSRTVADPTPQTTNPERSQVELSPGQLRKSRARPPSAGSAKDVGIVYQVEDSTKTVVVQSGSDGQKLPRSGISVMISPHGKNGENRREALKKLGLLRD